jgi:hypothetical protein
MALINFKAGGVGQYFESPDHTGPVREVYASTCAHCTQITEFARAKDMMNHVEFCRGCMRLICLECYGKPCRPAEAEAERQELEARIRGNVERQAWRCS